jgi:orotidine-5'-phosphate decarboxylase
MAEIIVALDLPSAEEADRLLERLPGLRWVKVGSILMTRAGPAFVRRLVDRGLQVFLDLKWHDIPNTVAGAVSAGRDLGVSMATVHTLGGPAMMRAAAAAADGAVALVGVTVLTSHAADDYDRATGREGTDLALEVDRLAAAALASGLDGVVCSPQETARVRTVAGPRALIVVPGIRRAGDAAGDQSRTADPATAAARGATHLVVGRPILAAADPAAAYAELAEAAALRATSGTPRDRPSPAS